MAVQILEDTVYLLVQIRAMRKNNGRTRETLELGKVASAYSVLNIFLERSILNAQKEHDEKVCVDVRTITSLRVADHE